MTPKRPYAQKSNLNMCAFPPTRLRVFSARTICTASDKYDLDCCETEKEQLVRTTMANMYFQEETYAAVAEKISAFLASVIMDKASENMAVKMIVNPIRMSIDLMK